MGFRATPYAFRVKALLYQAVSTPTRREIARLTSDTPGPIGQAPAPPPPAGITAELLLPPPPPQSVLRLDQVLCVGLGLGARVWNMGVKARWS